MFSILPNEVVSKIISKLDDKQLLTINILSKQFKDIYNEYFIHYIKNILTIKVFMLIILIMYKD